MFKGLILGSAAGLIAMSGARAADLPVKAKAVEYVRVCSLYGAGFFYIPGTDTCIKLGGYLRVDSTFNGGIYNSPAWSGDIGQGNRYRNYYAARSRMALTIDTRTATEYGVVRTFVHGNFQFSTFGGSTVNPNAIALASGLDTVDGGAVPIQAVFMQFAGFTFGKSSSAYATPWNGYPGNFTSFLLGGNDSVTGVNNIQYTAQFGNGVSGTIGLDDPGAPNRTIVGNLNLPLSATFGSSNAYAGVYAPDIVGNIRVEQAWGLFQISAAAHEIRAAYNAVSGTAGAELTGHPETKWGGAVMAALQIKNIPTGPGDDIKVDASWTKGDTKNVISTSSTSPSFAMFSGTGLAGAYQSIGFGATTDAVYLPAINGGDGTLHLTEAFGVRGAFNHNWDPFWSSSLFGSYSAVRYDGTAKAAACTNYIGTRTVANGRLSSDFNCNPDFNVSQLGLITRWTPVKNLAFSAELMWFHLDQKFTGAAVLSPTAPKPSATYEFKDQDTFSLNLAIQRNF